MIFDPRQGSEIVATELVNLKMRIINNMQREKAVASGRTIRSLHVLREEKGAKLITDGKMPFGVLETGRRGGNVPRGFGYIILQWMKDKGLHAEPVEYKDPNKPHKYSPQERADMGMAFAIAKKIQREGSSLYRRGGRETIYTREIPKTIEAVKQKMNVFMRVASGEFITNNFKEFKK